MTAVVTEHSTVRKRAAAAAKAREVADARYAAERAEQAREYETSHLARELKRYLDLDVDVAAITYHRSADNPRATPAATITIDGVTFGIAPVFAGDPGTLTARAECSKGCGLALWVNAEGWEALHRALTGEHEHPYRYDCLVKYGEDGEPITDREGKLLPPKSAVAAPPPPTAEQRLADVVREIVRDELANQGVGI